MYDANLTDAPSHGSSRWHRARCDYRCDACHDAIFLGELYHNERFCFPGYGWESVKKCAGCALHWFRLCEETDEEEWPDWRLDCGDWLEPGSSLYEELAELLLAGRQEHQRLATIFLIKNP